MVVFLFCFMTVTMPISGNINSSRSENNREKELFFLFVYSHLSVERRIINAVPLNVNK